MLPYVLLVGVPCVLALLSKRIRLGGKENSIVISSFFFILIVLLSCRGEYVGNDTGSYSVYYGYFSELRWEEIFSTEIEPAFALFMKISSFSGLNYQSFLTIVAYISIVPIWRFYKAEKNASIFTIALFLGIVTVSMYFSGLRQVIAMAFAFPAYYYARDKKPFAFLIMVFIAFLFHRSAFILLFIYPLCNLIITLKWLWVVIPVIGIIYALNKPIFSFLAVFIGGMYSTDTTSTGAYAIILLLVMITVYAFMLPDETLIDSDTIALRNILLLSVALQCFAPIHVLAMRMNYYFLPFIPVLVTRVASNAAEKNKKIAQFSVILMTIFFITYFFYNTSQGGGLNIYPYRPFWSDI